MTATQENMETILAGGKMVLATAGSGIVAVALSETTQVPIGWLIGGCFAIAGGAFAAGVSLQSVRSRLDRLERAVQRLEDRKEDGDGKHHHEED